MSQRTVETKAELSGSLSETEFLAAIIESSHDAIVGTLDGAITSWNPGAELMYGYVATEAVGQPISLIIPAHCMDEAEHIFERIRQGNRVDHFETERLAKGGHIIRVSLTASPVRDRTGKVVGASTVARDISHLRKTEAVLAESERRYQSLLETSIHGIFRATLDGQFLEVNPALVRLLGYKDRDEVLPLNIPTDVCVDPAAHAKLIEACMSDHKVQQDVPWKLKNGKHIIVRVSAHIVCSNLQAAMEAIVEDVTYQLEFKNKLQQLECTELLGQLAGGIAHDFNNYLNIVMDHEYLLSRALGTAEDLQHHLLEIRKAVERAAELTKRLLLVGKKGSGTPEEEIKLNAAVQEAGSMLKGTLSSHVSLILDLCPHEKTVHAAPGEIQRIVVNLVLNARDAMPAGGRIRITTGQKTFSKLTKTIAGDYFSALIRFCLWPITVMGWIVRRLSFLGAVLFTQAGG